MDRTDMTVGEQRGIELGGLFGVAVEPQAGRDARHETLLQKRLLRGSDRLLAARMTINPIGRPSLFG